MEKERARIGFFDNTTELPVLKPAFSKNSVPIVLSSDDFYAPYMGVLIQSIIENAHSYNNYDIIILHTDISEENRNLIKSLVKGMANFSIRFTDISDNIGTRSFSVWAHYKKYNVYRLVAPEILSQYDKALYFDSDIVVNNDVAELYSTELGDNLIAAIPDIRYHSWNNEEGNSLQIYARDVLKLPETHKYFNSGVLIYNLSEFRKTYTSDFMLDYCSQRHWQYIDQDVLNITCANKTLFLPQTWNILISADNFATEARAPLAIYEDYLAGHKSPKVVHYAGNFMPCVTPTVDLYWFFWEYARKTPFYEILIHRMIRKQMEVENPANVIQPPYKSIPRKIADVTMPVGSKRRKLAKRILHKGSRRWNFFKNIYYAFGGK